MLVSFQYALPYEKSKGLLEFSNPTILEIGTREEAFFAARVMAATYSNKIRLTFPSSVHVDVSRLSGAYVDSTPYLMKAKLGINN